MRHYWRGMVDGDGSVCDGKKIWLSLCGTRVVVEAFAAYGRKINGSHMYARPTTPNTWMIAFGEKKAKELARHLYEGATVSLERKQIKAESLMARIFLGHANRVVTEETKARIANWHRGRKKKSPSPETRKVLAEKTRAWHARRRAALA